MGSIESDGLLHESKLKINVYGRAAILLSMENVNEKFGGFDALQQFLFRWKAVGKFTPYPHRGRYILQKPSSKA